MAGNSRFRAVAYPRSSHLSHSHSRLTRALSAVASAALVLSGISLVMVAPANAAPVAVTVTGNDIVSHPTVYQGWHEGYNEGSILNPLRAFFVDTDGLHLGVGTHSQILNGTAPVSVTAAELQSIIENSALEVTSGTPTFQIPLWFGPGNPQDYTTLRSTGSTVGTNTWSTSALWESSANIPNAGTPVVAKNTPTSLADILSALGTQGSLRLLGFGVQSSYPAVVPSLTYNGTEYQFVPYVAAAPGEQEVVRDKDLLGVEQDDPNLAGFNYESWHEGKDVKTSSVESDGLHFGSSYGSTTVKGTTVKTAPDDNVVTQAQLQALITGASFTITSGNANFQVPVNFGPGLADFTTLMSENFTPGTHTFSLNDTWRMSRMFGPYTQNFQEVKLGDLLDTLFSSSVSGGEVWLAGFGVQSNTASVVPSLVWDGTDYLFQQPETQVCTTTTTAPTVTNQDSQGWTFGQTRSTGHNDFVADGLHVWTEGSTSTDKAAGYKAVNFPLSDVGSDPVINMIDTSGGVPSLQLGISFDGDGSWNGYLVNEATAYPDNADEWWSTSNTFAGPHSPTIFGHPAGTLDEWLALYPDAKVISIGYSLGSTVLGSATITSIVAGCTSYGFVSDDTYPTTTTVNVDDSQILPIEDVTGWGDGYGHSPRSYSTQSDGAHIGNGHATQLFYTYPALMPTAELESLLTQGSIDVESGSATYQVAIRYGDNNTFTTLRSQSLTSAGNNFSVSDKWTSTRALFDNADVNHENPLTGTNFTAPIADLVAFFNGQGNVKVQGFGVQADSPAVVQNLVFNGTKYVFVPTGATAPTNDVRVTQPEIDLTEASDGSNYMNWHQGYANQTGVNQTFAVGEDGLILTPGNDPVTPRTQILKGLDTPVPGADLYALLTTRAGITTGPSSGDVTYQVPVTFYDPAYTDNKGWSTLRSLSLPAGTHTFSLSDLWASSKPIGTTILAAGPDNTNVYTLGDILDALNAQGTDQAIGFGVQTNVPALVTDITWGDTRYYFDGPITAGTVTIDGTPTFGETLTANEGTWAPSNVTFTYQWKANGADILGATSQSYTPTADKVGTTLAVAITGSATGYTDVTSTSLGVPFAAATLTTATPTISGTALAGEMLTADAGTWGPSGVALAYQWYANNVAILGATSSTYVLTEAENTATITVKVTGSLDGYTTETETSADFGPAMLKTMTTATPTVSGTTMVGATLTVDANASSWTPSAGVTFSYEWLADGVGISGATNSTYQLTAAEVGKAISVKVTGSATNYASASAISSETGAVASAPPGTTCDAPDFSNGKYEVHLGRGLEERNAPAVFNIDSYGGLVAADDPSDTFAEIQALGAGWNNTYIRTVDEPGHDFSNGYTITYTFVEKIVTGTVTANGDCHSLVWTYVDIPEVTAGSPTITGDAVVGAVLTAHANDATWTPTTGVTFGYQWKANGAAISGATSSTFTPTAAELGLTISVTVTGSAEGYRDNSATSGGTDEVATPFFADVNPGEGFFTEIQWMGVSGTSTGTAQETGKPLYLPAANVSRQAMAAFLYRLSGNTTFVAPADPTFADVPTDASFYTAIEWMASEGISTGTVQETGKPLFKPADPVSRSAMAAFLYRFEDASYTAPAESPFADVQTSSQFYNEIAWMSSTGISTGYENGSDLPLYKSGDSVTRRAMGAFIYRIGHP